MITSTDALSELSAAFPAQALQPEAAFGEGGTTYLSANAFMAGREGDVPSPVEFR